MSEPLSKTEIEDVLSSIRRLVAEDLRPYAAPRSVPSAAADIALVKMNSEPQLNNDPRPGQKLLLTPALRVVSVDDNPAPSTQLTDQSSFAPQADWDSDVEAEPALTEPLLDEVSADMADQAWVFDQDFRETTDDSVVLQTVESADPDGDRIEMGTQPDADFDDLSTWEPQSEEPAFVSVRGANLAEDVPGWAQSEDSSDFGQSDDPKPEPATGNIEPDPEWADAAEADVLAELADNAAQFDHDSFETARLAEAKQSGEDVNFTEHAAADFDAVAPIHDEALLREIVRDLLREELQGSMGERITRNIRKLVRAEVAQALATRDLN